jgi:hypothetical protein
MPALVKSTELSLGTQRVQEAQSLKLMVNSQLVSPFPEHWSTTKAAKVLFVVKRLTGTLTVVTFFQLYWQSLVVLAIKVPFR